MTEEIARKWCI